MKNLKRFELMYQYADYINSNMALLPNISFVKETQRVLYNPKPNGPSLLPLKFKPYYNDEWEEYDMVEDYKDESNKEYNAAIYNTIISLINDGTTNNLYKVDSVVLYIERDEMTEDIVGTAFDYLDPLENPSKYEDYSDGEYIILRGYSDECVEWIYLYADGSIRVRLGD